MDHEQLLALGGFAIMVGVAAIMFVLRKLLDRGGPIKVGNPQPGYRIEMAPLGANIDGTPMGVGSDAHGRTYGAPEMRF